MQTNTNKRSYKSTNRTANRMKELINSNFSGVLKGGRNELFITLTSDDMDLCFVDGNPEYNATVLKTFRKQFNTFMRRFKKRYEINPDKPLKWFAALEIQERGCPHIHLLVKNEAVYKWYIANEEVAILWDEGYTYTQQLKDPVHLSHYLMNIIPNAEITSDTNVPEGSEVIERTVKGVKKSYIKGGRLANLPKGARLYSSSSNLSKPDKAVMTAIEARSQATSNWMNAGSQHTYHSTDGKWNMPVEERQIDFSEIVKLFEDDDNSDVA